MKPCYSILINIVFFLFCTTDLSAQVPVPYSSSFDTTADTLGWSHYAVYGTDDWELGSPLKTYLNGTFTTPNAWVTRLSGTPYTFSSRCIQSPAFDMSDTTGKYYISFYQKRQMYSGMTYFAEYSLDGGTTWLMLAGTGIPQSAWQPVSGGFGGSSGSSWIYSTFCMKTLQGNPSVTIRFRMNTTSTATGEGWEIDNFSIRKEDFDASANRGLDITNVNKYFTSVNVTSQLGFSGPYGATMTNRFYFSNDSIFDAGDSLLYTTSATYFATIPSWTKTVNIPANLFARTYYIFYVLDDLAQINETDETDNISYAELHIDSIFVADYSDNFDHADEYWNTSSAAGSNKWMKGDPDQWQAEDPHSGDQCWFPVDSIGTNLYLESPYMNLQSSTNSTLCFWYQDTRITSYYAPSWVDLPSLAPATTTPPSFSGSGTFLPYPRNKWDCYCKSISAYDGNISTRFRITTGSVDQVPPDFRGIIVDDIYIGTAKSDASVEGHKRGRFTSTARTSDTLFYLYYNSGMAALPASQTDFYWSTDSLLDAGDILLSAKPEPSLGDTLFSKESLIYTKPTLAPGKYFIIYVTDPSDLISEMREFNNTGYFEVYQRPIANLPYVNDFETQIDDWSHTSLIGSDDWVWGTPSKPSMPGAFSGTKAWVTKETGGATPHSSMQLISPIFDLSQLTDPAIRFNMTNFTLNTSYWTQGASNMSYSTDGGYTWRALKPSNRSFARWYERSDYDYYGYDKWVYAYRSSIFPGKDEPMFNDNFTWQSRDADEVTTFCMDMIALRNYTQVQFRLNFANENGGMDGVMMDDFTILEALPDLEITNTRNLFCDSTDQFLKINLSIKNTGNKISNKVDYNVYLSTDTLLDGGDLLLFSDTNVDTLKPSYRREYFIKAPVPANYASFNYVIFQIDPTNTLTEMNEGNNVRFWPLNLDTNPTMNYFNDFESAEIDGWTHYIDSSGYYWGHRFRHIKLKNELAYSVSSGQWFMDPMVTIPSFLSGLPRHYLETPSFDFSNYSNIRTEFDFVCIGSSYFSSLQGGNFQYSDDGGMTWTTLTTAQDPYAVNWYNTPSITTIFNEPGWAHLTGFSGIPTFLHAEYNLSFLQGKSNVRFRFQYCANIQPASPGAQGFRLDNFEINSSAVDLVANEIMVPVMADIAIPSFPVNYSISNTGNAYANPTSTKFYWSEDNVLDTSDVQLYNFPESIVNAVSTNSHTRNIYYPVPVTQMVYYLFYVVDEADVVNESNESNNQGSFVITFNGLSGVGELSLDEHAVAAVNGGMLQVSGWLENEEKNGTSELFDVSGKLIRSGRFDISNRKFEFEVPVSEFAAGIYLLNLRFSGNETKQIKWRLVK